MNKKGNLIQKLLAGARCLIDEYQAADRLVDDIRREAYNAKRKAWEDRPDNGFEDVMKAFALCGVFLSLIVGGELALEKWETKMEKAKVVQTSDVKKADIKLPEAFNNVNFFTDIAVDETAKKGDQIPVIAPFIMAMNQKTRE